MVHVELSTSQCRFLYGFLRLLLAADKENPAAAACDLLQKFGAALQLLHRLIEIDDVNLIALFEDERLHLRIPALRLVSEMDASFQ